MNYRHIYHAGNICDVVKHAVLTTLLLRLREKEKPFTVIDTHAGIGLYDLEDERAQKTTEAQEGILRFLAAARIPSLSTYYEQIEKLNSTNDLADNLRFYPGSPLITRALLRPDDKLIACELHPEDAKTLKYNFYEDEQVQVHARNGYEALRALSPPASKRGLALIDPPFEKLDEFENLTKAVDYQNKHWSIGQMAIWYPVKDRLAICKWHDALVATGASKILMAEFIYNSQERNDKLNGSGFIFINPPYGFDEFLKTLFADLHKALKTNHAGIDINWLTPQN